MGQWEEVVLQARLIVAWDWRFDDLKGGVWDCFLLKIVRFLRNVNRIMVRVYHEMKAKESVPDSTHRWRRPPPSRTVT